jgi:hypothetical protein
MTNVYQTTKPSKVPFSHRYILRTAFAASKPDPVRSLRLYLSLRRDYFSYIGYDHQMKRTIRFLTVTLRYRPCSSKLKWKVRTYTPCKIFSVSAGTVYYHHRLRWDMLHKISNMHTVSVVTIIRLATLFIISIVSAGTAWKLSFIVDVSAGTSRLILSEFNCSIALMKYLPVWPTRYLPSQLECPLFHGLRRDDINIPPSPQGFLNVSR